MTELLPTPLGRILWIFTRRDAPAPPAQSAIDLKVALASIHGHRFGLAASATPTKAPVGDVDESGTPSEPIPPNPFAGGFYDLLFPPVADLVEREFRLQFILDEAQRIKNPEAIMSKAIKTLKSPYRWALSGTPLENRTDDLRSILDFLDLQPGGHRPGLAAPAEIKTQLTSCMLRRKKADVLKELPPKRFQERWLELSKDQRTAYDLARAEGIVRIMAGLAGATGAQELQQVMIEHVFALITRLKQICNRDPLSGASAKFDVLAEELEEIAAEGSKALVFSQYRESIIQIQRDLADRGIRAEVYHGNLTTQQRESALTAFRKTEEIPVLLMTTKAGGLGLNLQEASYVYHFDQMWNPAANAQAEDRAHRIGQDKSLLVTSLLARDTIDERIMEILNEKRALFAEFVDSTAAEPTQEKAATLALRALGLDPGLMGK